MADFLTDFLASILQEEGVSNAREVAAKAAADLRKARFVDQGRVESLELHHKVDTLRGSGVSASAIAIRFGINRSTVHKIVQEQMGARKK